jgi:hypothetical protein
MENRGQKPQAAARERNGRKARSQEKREKAEARRGEASRCLKRLSPSRE